MARLVIGLIAVLLGTAMGRAADYEIDCQLWRGDPQGTRAAGTQRQVSAPVLVSKSAETGTLLAGGHVKIGGQMVPVGREVEVTATTADHGAVRVRVVLKSHMVVGAAGAQQVSTAREETVATIQPGGTVRVMMGSDPKNRQWVDVTVRTLK